MPTTFLSPSIGLTNSDLENATASASDVMSGKSFYSGNDTLKYGTMTLSATATESDVVSGKTFFADSNSIRTGTMRKTDPSTFTASRLGYNQIKGDWADGSITINTKVNGIYFIVWAAHSSQMDGPVLPSGMTWLVNYQLQGTREGAVAPPNPHCYSMYGGIARASTSGSKRINYGAGLDYAAAGIIVFELNT